MRRQTIGSGASALLLLATVAQAHKGSHEQLQAIHKRHRESRITKKTNESQNFELEKRGGQCVFPSDAGLVAVTPGSANAGWAMSPDQSCTPGMYCPYACPPGQVSMQWDPSATAYSYPQSMNGGLYCDSNGQISKPFPSKPYCQSTATNIGIVNNAGGIVSFCQTVLPGNEAMLIPTTCTGSATLAVPGNDYWAGTAAHYYINPPGTDAGTACVWGSSTNPWGNWSPYVAGANVDASGETFIKLGWNPIYLETTTPFRNTMPDWGVKIDCPNGGCNGLPCAIDPSTNKVNQMLGGASSGAGGGNFCVVTVAKGSTANFVVYSGSGSSSGNSGTGSASSRSSSAVSKGGQFYQSSAVSSSSSPSTTAASTTPSTTASTTAKPTTTSTSESETETDFDNMTNSTMTESSSSWSMPNSTSHKAGPTGQPYYSLFNTTLPQTTSEGAAETAAAATQQAEASATRPIASGNGAGAASINLFALAPLAIWSLL